MIPEVKRFSTVSTSPTKREARVPGSSPVSLSEVRHMNFSIRLLLSACVIFCPNTVSRPSLADSMNPVSASIAK